MSELVTARISAHAARLGLHQLAASAPALIQRAHDAQLGYADFLDLILGEETAAKDDRRFASALHVSGLPHHKTLDDFDFTFQPDLDIRKIKDLATLDFVTQAANIAMLGPAPAKPTSPAPWPSPPAPPANPSTSPASTT